MRRILIGLIILAFSGSVIAAETPVPGHAVVARAEGAALVIWDATGEVAGIVKDRAADGAAKDRLERDALREIVSTAPKLPAATSITVRIVYTKSGDVSPVYGSPTFAGIERYATVTLTDADIKKDRDKWKEAAEGSDPLPGFVTVAVVGQLPPR